MPSNRTVGMKGAKAANIKTSYHEKIHYFVFLLYCADGIKLNPIIVLKRETRTKHTEAPTGVVFTYMNRVQ